MADTSSPESEVQSPNKRKASAAGLAGRPPRTVKRRASKACQCCRARKVRCNVVEHGAPCTNCRLDEVECIVTESKRKRKSWSKLEGEPEYRPTSSSTYVPADKARSNSAISDITTIEPSNIAFDFENDEHVPHTLYQTHGSRLNLQKPSPKPSSQFAGRPQLPLFGHDATMMDNRHAFYPWVLPSPPVASQLPPYIKPLPARIGPEEASYLERKNVLSVPELPLRSELLRSYIEFVHPFMPLLDLNDFLETIEEGNGSNGKISLLLFHAVMFTASSFVDIIHLNKAGYATRREARKAFYTKARLLYDFDYDSDRVSTVQALLLMTFWYESPDDPKDTWHWQGVATTAAYSIGLHRDPSTSNMDIKRQRLWKRIWWSCYMRDRLIALGMRRPTRIKSEDFDMPMLELEDFDLTALPESVSCVSSDCLVARDVEMQRKLAIMCIEKTKLCQRVSQVLAAQYSVVSQNLGVKTEEGVTRASTVLVPKPPGSAQVDVQAAHDDLESWFQGLPAMAQLDASSGAGFPEDASCLVVAKSLLHMVYYSTLSALHRPQVLPSAVSASQGDTWTSDIQELSRASVRLATDSITTIAVQLHARNLVRYLSTAGVTVLLPAIIIHLLDIKAPREETRRSSLHGFCQCMQVLRALSEMYASADYSMAYLEAAVRKANIRVPSWVIDEEQDLSDDSIAELTTLTPPASESERSNSSYFMRGSEDITLTTRLEAFLACTPPESDGQDGQDYDPYVRPGFTIGHDFETEFGALVDCGAAPENAYEDGALVPMQGESSGFTSEMDFMKSDKPEETKKASRLETGKRNEESTLVDEIAS